MHCAVGTMTACALLYAMCNMWSHTIVTYDIYAVNQHVLRDAQGRDFKFLWACSEDHAGCTEPC